MTDKRKPKTVKRVDRGESIEMVARSLDVTAANTGRWREKAGNGSGGFEKE
ncbi:MAG: transposase [Betaproteobacteria bacterium AqS2]|uniref:Transposase n=1 Tax=Candidatus Amphirhobacter heronislandensis TaxID=1732024 RepID=A0A930UJ49_9GAMM|nr:transposase [Betaproteobacteria bacterium AqS2]